MLKESPTTFLENNLNGNLDFAGTVLMGLKALDADLNKNEVQAQQVTVPASGLLVLFVLTA